MVDFIVSSVNSCGRIPLRGRELQVGVAESYGLSSQELNEFAKVVADNRQLIERA